MAGVNASQFNASILLGLNESEHEFTIFTVYHHDKRCVLDVQQWDEIVHTDLQGNRLAAQVHTIAQEMRLVKAYILRKPYLFDMSEQNMVVAGETVPDAQILRRYMKWIDQLELFPDPSQPDPGPPPMAVVPQQPAAVFNQPFIQFVARPAPQYAPPAPPPADQ